MLKIKILLQKELRQYLASITGYLVMGLFLLVTGWIFWSNFFLKSQVTLADFFGIASWLMVVFVPVLGMRSLSSERASGTDEVLFTLPFSLTEIVIGKWLGIMAVVFLTLLTSLTFAISASRLGQLDWGSTLVGFLGLFLEAGLFAGISLMIGSRSRNPMVAFLATSVICFGLMLINTPLFTSILPVSLRPYLVTFSPQVHLQNFSVGLVSLKDLGYFALGILSFLVLCYLLLRSYDPDCDSRLKLGLGILVPIVALVFIFGNIGLTRVPQELDLSQGQSNSISKKSKSIIKNLPEGVTIHTYFSKTLPPQIINVRESANTALLQMSSANPSNLNIVSEDTTDPAKMQQSGVPSIQFSDVGQGKFEISQGYMGIVMEYEDKKEIIPVVNQTSDFEYQVISRLVSLTNADLPVAGVVDSSGQTTQGLQQILGRELKIVSLDLTGDDQLPDKLSMVIVPEGSNLTNGELLRLDGLLREGISSLILVSGAQVQAEFIGIQTPDNLKILLNPLKVEVNRTVIGDVSNEAIPLPTAQGNIIAPYPYFVKVISDNINGDPMLRRDLSSVMIAFPTELKINSDSPAVPLLKSSTKAFKAPESLNLQPSQELIDKVGNEQFTLGIAYKGVYPGLDKNLLGTEEVKKIRAIDKSTETKIIILGSQDVFADGVLGRFPQNITFLRNIGQYLSGNSLLLGVPSSKVTDHPINPLLPKSHYLIAQYGSLVSSMIILIAFGFLFRYFRERPRFVN